MAKLLLILALGGAIASGLSARAEPPLLVDGVQAPPLDLDR